MNEFSNSPAPKRYPVEVIRSERRAKTSEARLVNGVIKVRIPAWFSAQREEEVVTDFVERIELKMHSRNINLEARAQALAEKYHLPLPNSIRWVNNQDKRWGSCSRRSRNIRISNRLGKVPRWVLDHVILHELTHLVVPNHSKAFYDLLKRDPLTERATGYLMALSHRLDLGSLGDLAESPCTDETELRRAG